MTQTKLPHPLSLEARIIRKMRVTGLSRAEASEEVLAECAELEKRLRRPVLTEHGFKTVRIDSYQEPITKTAERIQSEYAEDLYIARRKRAIRLIGSAVFFVVVFAISAAAVVLAFAWR